MLTAFGPIRHQPRNEAENWYQRNALGVWMVCSEHKGPWTPIAASEVPDRVRQQAGELEKELELA